VSEVLKFKYLLTFSKTAALKFIGHLDVQKLFELAFRRSNLPLAFSEGFHPHMLFSIANPLSLGVESQCELLEIYLSRPEALEKIQNDLNAVLPADLKILKVEYCPSVSKPVMAQVKSVAYQFEFTDAQDAFNESQKFISSVEWKITRTGKNGSKEFDLRPRILKLEWPSSDMAIMECQADENGGVKLSEMLGIFGVMQRQPKIMRTAIHLKA
jgi:radical SAM-linked protein